MCFMFIVKMFIGLICKVIGKCIKIGVGICFFCLYRFLKSNLEKKKFFNGIGFLLNIYVKIILFWVYFLFLVWMLYGFVFENLKFFIFSLICYIEFVFLFKDDLIYICYLLVFLVYVC